MLKVSQILVMTPGCRLLLAAGMVGALAGCGLKGPLYLPGGDVAASRASLPGSLAPASAASAAGMGTGTANPPLIP